MTKKEVIRIALTEHEIEKLVNNKIATPRLEKVRNIFIFCCYDGLAYADVKN